MINNMRSNLIISKLIQEFQFKEQNGYLHGKVFAPIAKKRNYLRQLKNPLYSNVVVKINVGPKLSLKKSILNYFMIGQHITPKRRKPLMPICNRL